MANKETVKGYMEGREGRERRGDFELIPTTKAAGAPEGNLHLVEFQDCEVRHSGDASNHPGHAYINYGAEILEPESFAGRRVFGMFYFMPDYEDDPDLSDDDNEKASQRVVIMQDETLGDFDSILGVGFAQGLVVEDHEDWMQSLADALEGRQAVVKIGLKAARRKEKAEAGEKPLKVKGVVIDGVDEVGNECYTAQNRLTKFMSEDDWVSLDLED